MKNWLVVGLFLWPEPMRAVTVLVLISHSPAQHQSYSRTTKDQVKNICENTTKNRCPFFWVFSLRWIEEWCPTELLLWGFTTRPNSVTAAVKITTGNFLFWYFLIILLLVLFPWAFYGWWESSVPLLLQLSELLWNSEL